MKYVILVSLVLQSACTSIHRTKNNVAKANTYSQFILKENKIIFKELATPSDLTLGVWNKINFQNDGQNITLQNDFPENSSDKPQTAKLISKTFTMPLDDRLIINIKNSIDFNANDFSNLEHYFPIVTNANFANMPTQRILDRLDQKQNIREQKFIVKIPKSGVYKIFFIRLGPDKNFGEVNFFIGENQNKEPKSTNSCKDQLAFNLRHCIESQCTIDMTDSYTPLETPPAPLTYQYTIKPQNDFCHIKVISSADKTKNCSIPISLNSIIQDSAQPFKDPQFVKLLNQYHNEIYQANTPEDLKKTTQEIQALWFDHYPLSLMSMKEIEFQLPDLEILMKKYCKEIENTGDQNLIAWRENLLQKIAIKQATLNFKSNTLFNDDSKNSHNELIKQNEILNKEEELCYKQNKINECVSLAEKYDKQSDYSNAAKVSVHACNLNHGLSCQKAGLSLTQANQRDKARTYEKKGCELKDSISCYNVACGYCLEGNTSLAEKFFKLHLKLGVEEPMLVIFDPTIQCLNKTKVFQEFVEKTLAP